MSTAYTLEAGPQQGRIDASGNDGLGVYEIENGTVEVESYADAAALVDAFSHVRWIDGDPKPDETDDEAEADDEADADDGAVDDGDDTEADETTDDAATDAVDGGSEGDDDEAADASDDGAVEALAAMEYGDLQELAIAHDIKGNQSAEVLAETLAEMGVTADDA